MNWIEKVNAEIVRKTNSVTVCEVEQNHEKNNIRSSNDESELQHELSCGNCGTTFVRYCDLENHLIEVHKKEKNFKCNTCQKDFVLKWRLKKHILIHTSSRYRQHLHIMGFCRLDSLVSPRPDIYKSKLTHRPIAEFMFELQ